MFFVCSRRGLWDSPDNVLSWATGHGFEQLHEKHEILGGWPRETMNERDTNGDIRGGDSAAT